jgi:hypothetical protein
MIPGGLSRCSSISRPVTSALPQRAARPRPRTDRRSRRRSRHRRDPPDRRPRWLPRGRLPLLARHRPDRPRGVAIRPQPRQPRHPAAGRGTNDPRVPRRRARARSRERAQPLTRRHDRERNRTLAHGGPYPLVADATEPVAEPRPCRTGGLACRQVRSGGNVREGVGVRTGPAGVTFVERSDPRHVVDVELEVKELVVLLDPRRRR